MHWVVNTCLKREGGYDALIHQIERQGQPYTLVRKPPFRLEGIFGHDHGTGKIRKLAI